MYDAATCGTLPNETVCKEVTPIMVNLTGKIQKQNSTRLKTTTSGIGRAGAFKTSDNKYSGFEPTYSLIITHLY